MEVTELKEEDMNSRGSKSDNFSILDRGYMKRTSTGRYEKINNEMYEVHRDLDESRCTAGTEHTFRVAHLKCDKKKSTFWVSLCQKHYQKVKENNEIEILSDTRQPY